MRTRHLVFVATSLCVPACLLLCCNIDEGGLSTDGGSVLDVTIDATDSAPEQDSAGDAASDATPDVDAGIPIVPAAPIELDASLVVWYRDDFVFSDAGALDATTIFAWQDKSGNGKDAIVPSASVAPTYTSNDATFGGHPSLTFMGTARLEAASVTISAQPITAFVVGAAPLAVNNEYFFDSLGAGNSRIAMLDRVSTTNVALYTDQGAGSYAPLSGIDANGAPNVFIGIFAGTSSSFYVSANTGLKGLNLGTSTLQGLSVGNYVSNSFPLRGTIVEIALWSQQLDGISIQRLNQYVNVRYGVAISP